MTNVICAIAKCEEEYIKDGVEGHLNLGFDHIYVYDNSDTEEKALKNYYNNDKLTYIPVYGIHKSMFQIECYNNFYHSYNFDGCAFIDLDEFIILNKGNNIADFTNDTIFKDAQVIKLNGHLYGDDNKLERDMSLPVYKGITNGIINHPYNYHGKEIIRGGIKNLKIESTHGSSVDGVLSYQIMPDGKVTYGKVNGMRNCNEAYINHYMTKTLKEYVNQKLNRGDACILNRSLGMQYYGDINKMTPEKVKGINEHLGG